MRQPPDTVKLVGLDLGSTTSSALVASARLVRSTGAGRVELREVRETYRSPMVFTPLREDDHLDLGAVERMLDDWLGAGQVAPEEIFGGGALLTGLTARREN